MITRLYYVVLRYACCNYVKITVAFSFYHRTIAYFIYRFYCFKLLLLCNVSVRVRVWFRIRIRVRVSVRVRVRVNQASLMDKDH